MQEAERFVKKRAFFYYERPSPLDVPAVRLRVRFVHSEHFLLFPKKAEPHPPLRRSPVSPRLGRASALTVHRTVIHYRSVASLLREEKAGESLIHRCGGPPSPRGEGWGGGEKAGEEGEGGRDLPSPVGEGGSERERTDG